MNSSNISVCNSISKVADWILDSGAIDHICCYLALFTAYKHIQPVQIKLPNVNQVLATIAGTVSFSPSLTLINVLYLPMFAFNLISV